MFIVWETMQTRIFARDIGSAIANAGGDPANIGRTIINLIDKNAFYPKK